jgi:hypothetical protein
MTKLKIDLNNGVLEVDGEEDFVKEIYKEYKDRMLTSFSKAAPDLKNVPESPTATAGKKAIKSSSKSPRKENYSLIKEIQLGELKAFYDSKSPKTGFEKNVVFVYYLQKILKLQNISPDHIYTCYKLMSVPLPKAIRQSLVDTYHSKTWIDSSNMNDLVVLTVGENVVEHDLPRKG